MRTHRHRLGATPKTAEREFQIQVQPSIDIDNPKTTTYGTVNQPYSNQLTATQVTNTESTDGYSRDDSPMVCRLRAVRRPA